MSQFFKYFENCISKLQNSFFITICILCCAVLYLVAQLCPTLCDPMDSQKKKKKKKNRHTVNISRLGYTKK